MLLETIISVSGRKEGSEEGDEGRKRSQIRGRRQGNKWEEAGHV